MKTLKVHKTRNSLMQLKPFWHNIEQLQNKEVDIMSSNIENGGKDSNSVDITIIWTMVNYNRRCN